MGMSHLGPAGGSGDSQVNAGPSSRPAVQPGCFHGMCVDVCECRKVPPGLSPTQEHVHAAVGPPVRLADVAVALGAVH